jgi:ABC-type multidrug transport system fused ATPase/permease subunit
MEDFFESLKSIIKNIYDKLKSYFYELWDYIKDIYNYINIFKRIIDYFKQDYEIVFKTKCNMIYNDIKEIANLPYYLIIYFLILLFLFIIIILAYFYNFLSSYLHGEFIVSNNSIRTYIWIFIIIFLPIMILYSYYIHKRFSIKRLGILIFKLFIFLTAYLALQISIVYGFINEMVGFSLGLKILNFMYDVVFTFVIYYMGIILALFFRCPHLLKELIKYLNKVSSQYGQYMKNLNRIFWQNNQIYNQNKTFNYNNEVLRRNINQNRQIFEESNRIWLNANKKLGQIFEENNKMWREVNNRINQIFNTPIFGQTEIFTRDYTFNNDKKLKDTKNLNKTSDKEKRYKDFDS